MKMKHFESHHKRLWFALMSLAVIVLASLTQLPYASADRAGHPQPESQAVSPAMATSVAAAMAGIEKRSMHLIDVRSPLDFEQYRIPGSINMAPHAIRIRPFLKSNPIVLVNEGFALTHLAATCEVLNKEGFQATILAGGLPAWQAQGGRLIGDPLAMHQSNTVTPRQLAQEAGSVHHLIIDASGPAAPPGGSALANVQALEIMDNPQGPAKINELLATGRADPFFSILISARGGRENDRIQRQLTEAGIRRVYFLQDGWKAYEQYLHDQLLAGRPKEERQISTGACRSCTQ